MSVKKSPVTDQEYISAFRDAVNDDLKALKKVVKKDGFDIEYRSNITLKGKIRQNVTLLWAVCAVGSLPITQFLISVHKPKVDVEDKEGCSVFWAACYGGNIQVVKLIYGRSPTYQDQWVTPLAAACEGGHQEVVEYLLNKHFDVNARLWHQRTALHIAAYAGHQRIVQALLDYGARELKDDYGMTPIEVAAAEGHRDCVNAFLRVGRYSNDTKHRLELLGAAARLLKNSNTIQYSVNEAVCALAENEGDLCDNFPPLSILIVGNEGEIIGLSEPEKARLKEIKQSLQIYQQVLGLGNSFTIKAFFQYLGKIESRTEWLFLLDSVTKKLGPLDDQTINVFSHFLSQSPFSVNGVIFDRNREENTDILRAITELLFSEIIRGYRVLRPSQIPSWFDDKCQLSMSANFDKIFMLLLRHFTNLWRLKDAIDYQQLTTQNYDIITWLVHNLVTDSQQRSLLHLHLDRSVNEVDHLFSVRLIKDTLGLGGGPGGLNLKDRHNRTVLDVAMRLQHPNLELIELILFNTTTQPMIDEHLFKMISKLETLRFTAAVDLLWKRIPITSETVEKLYAATGDLSSIISFAERSNDKIVMSEVANICVQSSMVVEAIQCLTRLKDFSKYSAMFQMALKDQGFRRWNEVARFLKVAKNVRNLDSRAEKLTVESEESGKEDEALEKVIKDECLCELCFEEKKECVFIPCGHLGCCMKCRYEVNVCPFCRQAIIGRQRLFQT